MEPDGTGTRGRSRGVLAWAYRSLTAAPPEARLWRTRRWPYAMLVCGPGMIAVGALAALQENPSPFAFYQPIIGLALTLLALSDLLVGRPGARGAVLTLRVVAQLGSVAVILGWAWAAANGSGLAVLALAFGFGIAWIAYAVKKADARQS